jgi:hypothetical protein
LRFEAGIVELGDGRHGIDFRQDQRMFLLNAVQTESQTQLASYPMVGSIAANRVKLAAHHYLVPRFGFESGSCHVGFVVNKAQSDTAVGFLQVLLLPLPSIPLNAPHSSSPGAGTIGHLVTSVTVDSVPLHSKKQKKNHRNNFVLALTVCRVI